MPEENILLPDIGDCVELTDQTIAFGEKFQAGTRLIDGDGIEDYGTSEVMKDRMRMSEEGVFVVSVAVTGNFVINTPKIENRGFVFSGKLDKDADADISSVVERAIDGYDYEHGNKEELSACVYKALKNYIYKKTKKSPLIIVSVLDV